MWAYVLRKLLYNIPVYFGIILLMMAALRVNDPVNNYLGKHPTPEQRLALEKDMGLDQPFIVQYVMFIAHIPLLDFGDSWKYEGTTVRERLIRAVPPSLSFTVPTLLAAAMISIVVSLVSAYYRGRPVDKTLMILAVLGMSVSYLVYIILGQFFGAFWPREAQWSLAPFAISGYEPWIGMKDVEGGGSAFFFSPTTWVTYCLLPVIVGVIVAMGYDTRFYRAVMVEECTKDYIITALAKGATKRKIMFVHMLKNALIPIVTRVMTTLPFLITGSILLEMFFNIPGMGKTLITAINDNDFPMIQGFVAVFAAVMILTIILTDVIYALVDPRVRLS
ncbi:MAG: ABC transporter permease [Planctomycetes bacterium]|nr:ABC transporter permease [Planctomycetota bacterium]